MNIHASFADNAPLLLDSLSDGVYVTDLKRNILFWNRSAEAITGWTREQVTGRPCSDNVLVHVDMHGNRLCGSHLCPLHRAMELNESRILPDIVFAQTANGSRIPVETAVAPVRDEDGNVVGGIESFRSLSPLMNDLKRAHSIQKNILQCELKDEDEISANIHFQPLEFVSGDFYHVERINNHRYAVMIADVMGHGVSAALYTMQIRSLLEMEKTLLAYPAAFMAEVNRKLSAITAGASSFASAFYAVIDTGRDVMTYVNAGHTPPFLHRNGVASLLQGKGIPLGAREDAVFSEQSIPILENDRILLYTDGAIEARNANGVQLGEQGLLDMVNSCAGSCDSGALKTLASRILQYHAGVHLDDDLTLMSISIKSLCPVLE